jgi:hypothetical protein
LQPVLTQKRVVAGADICFTEKTAVFPLEAPARNTARSNKNHFLTIVYAAQSLAA